MIAARELSHGGVRQSVMRVTPSYLKKFIESRHATSETAADDESRAKRSPESGLCIEDFEFDQAASIALLRRR
jgi:hypothetical protein